jgi:hypothetical protein
MTFVLPRLDRSTALDILESYRWSPLREISVAMPNANVVLTYSAVGGQRIEQAELAALRSELLAVARAHGMLQTPGAIIDPSDWEAQSARLIHKRLEMTAHEASQEDVWSYITCCWLLDIAIWRFKPDASNDRFIGNLNRNTFRRMWWRCEVFGSSVDLALLGEDELVNIMERPTLFADRRLARSIALEFLERVSQGAVTDRMRLMREATKRLLRLTPFVAFPALEEAQIKLVVADAFDAAASGLAGAIVVMPSRSSEFVPAPSADVRPMPRLALTPPADRPPETLVEAAHAINFDEVAQAALSIAQRTGRVTNTSLREVVPVITSEEARDVFRVLIERGALVRRGVKRGTHYVIPDETDGSGLPEVPVAATAAPTPQSPPLPSPPPPRVPPRPHHRSETALQRLLRRMR